MNNTTFRHELRPREGQTGESVAAHLAQNIGGQWSYDSGILRATFPPERNMTALVLSRLVAKYLS